MSDVTEGRILSWRAFIEGIEVEVGSVVCSGRIGGAASLELIVPYSPVLLNLKPRSYVAIFYFETTSSVGSQLSREQLNDPGNIANWRLLFVGEFRSYGFSSAGGSRHMTLYCNDFTSYWESAKIYFGTKSASGGVPFRKAIALGGGQAVIDKDKLDKPQEILDLLTKTPKSLPGATGMLGGVISLLEAATGVYTPENPKEKFVPGLNAFLSQAEVRLRLTRTIAASALDTTAKEFINVASYKAYFKRLAASVQQTASYMQLIQMFLGRVYYQWASLVAPPYLPDGSVMEVKGEDTFKKTAAKIGSSKIDALISVVVKLLNAVNAFYTRRQSERRSEKLPGVDEFTYIPTDADSSGVYKQAPDFDGHRDFASVTRASGFQAYSRGLIGSLTDEFASDARKSGVLARINASVDVSTAGQIVAGTFELCSSMNTSIVNLTEANIQRLRSELENAADLFGKAATSSSKRVAGVRGEKEFKARLHMLLMCPDLFMCPPPKCNVLFPDDYAQIQYGRHYLDEITRLLLHGRNKAEQPTRDVYFSPYALLLSDNVLASNSIVDDVSLVKNSSEIDKALNSGAAFILRHEKYCGIIADVQILGDNDIFKSLHKKQQAEKAKAEQRVGDQAHLRRAADYLFFAKRFESRTAFVQARYLPRLIAGLPCLVLMPSRTEPKNPTSLNPPKYGTHLLGVIDMVRHVGNQSGGYTAVQLSKCRTHDEVPSMYGDDTWTVTDRSVAKKERKLKPPAGYEFQTELQGVTEFGTADISHLETPDAAKYVMNLHPVKGRTYNIVVKTYPQVTDEEIDNALSNAGFGTADTTPFAGSFAPDGHIPVDGTGLQNSGYESANISTGAHSQPITAVNLDVYETYTASTSKTTKTSFENSLPPWYDVGVFGPAVIGSKFYLPLLGCTSVLDGATFGKSDDFESAATTALEGAEMAVGYNKSTVFIAAESLAYAWLVMKENGADVVSFSEQYCSRNFASIPDILGTGNGYLNFIVDDWPVSVETDKNFAGFHGNAYGGLTGLKDFAGNDMVTGVDINIDPRAERYSIVEQYVNSIRTGFGGKS